MIGLNVFISRVSHISQTVIVSVKLLISLKGMPVKLWPKNQSIG